jgi:hypothetical protein
VRLQDIAPDDAQRRDRGVVEWIRENWNGIRERMLNEGVAMGEIVDVCKEGLTRKGEFEEAVGFFEKVDTKGFARVLEQSLDRIRASGV